jgi:general secretion pathway protein G
MVAAAMWRRPRAPERGFTLVELMTVILVIMILAGIALPRFRVSIVLAKEAALKEDLYRMRQAIDQYHADKGRYPASLQSLVEDGYLREIRKDPMTGAVDWVEVPYEGEADSPTGDEGGIENVHSASESTPVAGEEEGGTYSGW